MSPIETPPTSPPTTAKPAPPRSELASHKIDRSPRRKASSIVKLSWIAAVVAIAAALLAAGYWAFRDQLFPLPVVKAESVRIMTLGQASTELTATGYLESRWQAAVGAKVPGRIANIPVEEGDKVKAGDVLAELEHSDMDAMLASRKVAVELAEAQLTEAEFNLAQADRDMKRERDIFQRNAGTRAVMERAETSYEAAKAIQRARVAAVAAAKSAVLEAE